MADLPLIGNAGTCYSATCIPVFISICKNIYVHTVSYNVMNREQRKDIPSEIYGHTKLINITIQDNNNSNSNTR